MPSLQLVLSIMAVVFGTGSAAVPAESQLAFVREGDVNIGGLFPFKYENCDALPAMWGVQVSEAMIFAIDQINNRTDLLPGLDLGFHIRHSCFGESAALWSSLSLVGAEVASPGRQSPGAGCGTPPGGSPGKIVGIIGAPTSTTSITVSAVADLYEVPMISYFATSDELSDKERFPFFLRTVPPDRFQAEAMVDVVSYMNWDYISIAYWADTYGIRGAHAVASLAESRGICVALSVPIQRDPTASELEEVSAKIVATHRARVIMVFAIPETAAMIVQGVQAVAGGEDHFVWICSDGWLHGVSYETPPGSLFINIYIPEPPGFFDYLAGQERADTEENPWLERFLTDWEADRNCTVWVDEHCGMPHLEQYSTASAMAPVMDAVYAFAYALHSLVNSSQISDLHGQDVLSRLKRVRFEGIGGEFQFTSDGDAKGKYLIHNSQLIDGEVQLVMVGLWDALATGKRLTWYEDIIWPGGSMEVPPSTCVDVCLSGYRLAPLEEKCCFGCFQCEDYSIVVKNTECMECEETEWPDEDRLSCIPIIPSVTDWTDPMHLSILILSCMGLVLSVSIAIGLTVYRNHTVIKASSRELSSVNVLGLILAFVSVFLLSAQPTPALCCLSKAIVSLCFTLTYAPTLLKVSRIYRIFRASKKSAGRPKMTSPAVQLLMASGLIFIQVVCIVVTTIVSDCTPRSLVGVPRTNHLELYCELSTGFLVSSVYNLVLILACCLFAFLARKVPDNYNESKFIGVSVYSTLLACLAAIPVYVTARDVSQKVAAVCLAVLLNAYLTALCVYLPKFYAIKFIANSGDRAASTRTQGSTLTSNRVQPSAGPATNTTPTL